MCFGNSDVTSGYWHRCSFLQKRISLCKVPKKTKLTFFQFALLFTFLKSGVHIDSLEFLCKADWEEGFKFTTSPSGFPNAGVKGQWTNLCGAILHNAASPVSWPRPQVEDQLCAGHLAGGILCYVYIFNVLYQPSMKVVLILPFYS